MDERDYRAMNKQPEVKERLITVDQAILFVEWVDNSPYLRSPNGIWSNISEDDDNKTTSELFEMFNNK